MVSPWTLKGYIHSLRTICIYEYCMLPTNVSFMKFSSAPLRAYNVQTFLCPSMWLDRLKYVFLGSLGHFPLVSDMWHFMHLSIFLTFNSDYCTVNETNTLFQFHPFVPYSTLVPFTVFLDKLMTYVYSDELWSDPSEPFQTFQNMNNGFGAGFSNHVPKLIHLIGVHIIQIMPVDTVLGSQLYRLRILILQSHGKESLSEFIIWDWIVVEKLYR